MRNTVVICFTIIMLLVYGQAAWASSFIDISAADSTATLAVRHVWNGPMGVRWIGVVGGEQFAVNISESSPNSIDTCWIYINGSTTTGTSRLVTANDYRNYHCVAVIKYDNATYESREFWIKPAWPTTASVTTGIQAPTSGDSGINDSTVTGIISGVISNEPAGPGDSYQYCCCSEEACFEMTSTADECRGTDHECSDDNKCMNGG